MTRRRDVTPIGRWHLQLSDPVSRALTQPHVAKPHPRGLLEHHFVQLLRDSVMQQTNQIATALGALIQKNSEQYKEACRKKDAVKDATVEKCWARTTSRASSL